MNTYHEQILHSDGIKSPEEARRLASFFWKMVERHYFSLR
jgi:hypothetical protein